MSGRGIGVATGCRAGNLLNKPADDLRDLDCCKSCTFPLQKPG